VGLVGLSSYSLVDAPLNLFDWYCSFDALVKDLFPTANMKEIEYAELSVAIEEVYKEMKLVPMPSQVRNNPNSI
jgi:hypothetical protein